MKNIASYASLEDLGRVQLSKNFFMRDFLYSETAAWHGLRNIPDHPERAIHAGSQLCELLLEPLQATFGKIHVRSGYRSPSVNEFGNQNKLNCASNASNHAAHIWDYPDAAGKQGATACIVMPWLLEHMERGGQWTICLTAHCISFQNSQLSISNGMKTQCAALTAMHSPRGA